MGVSIVLEFARAEYADDPFAFRFVPQSYLLRHADGVFASAVFNWDQSLLDDLSAVRQPGRDPALQQRMGERLRQFLEGAGWAEHERIIQEALRRDQRVVLQIRSAAAELYALPWELLTLRTTGQHIGELRHVVLRYEWPGVAPMEASANERPPVSAGNEGGRILMVWAAAGGAVPAAEHEDAIAAACRDAALPFAHESDVLAHASYSRLSAALEAAVRAGRPVAVLHLLCHGSTIGSTFGLAFDSEEASSGIDLVDAGRLRQLLAPFASSLQLVVLSVCDSGNSGALGNPLGSVAQALHRVGIPGVVASRYPLSVPGSIKLTQTLYHELLIELSSLESALLAARTRLTRESDYLDWASLQLYTHLSVDEELRPVAVRPFRGLLTFQPENARFFFGRAAEISEIEGKLDALAQNHKPRFLVVAGASGSGKSSLVLAGVVPQLQARERTRRLVRLRPTNALSTLDALSQPEAAAQPALVIVDQLEELFTHIDDAAARTTFARRLWTLAQDAAGHAIIVTIRIDYLGRCSELSLDDAGLRLDAIGYADPHRVLVAQMSAEGMRQVITEPTRLAGLVLEDGLLQRMLRDVAEEPGALPLLEDTLDVLWQKRRGRYLTDAAYDEIGGVSGALKKRADALIESLSMAEQRLARRLLVRLVHVAADVAMYTRKSVLASALRPQKAADLAGHERVLAQLLAMRLVVSDGQGDKQRIEVAHEALLRQWPRLKDWVRDDQTRLAQLRQLEDWLKEWRQYGTLIVGEPLTIGEKIAKEQPDEVSAEALDFLEKSRKKAHGRTLFRRFMQVLLGLVLVYILIFSRLISRMAPNDELFTLFLFVMASVLLNLVTIPTILVMAWRWRK